MNRVFAIYLIFLSLSCVAFGMPAPPLDALLRGAQNIYLVKVTSTDGNKINFSITKVLRGKEQQLTHLIAGPGYDFKLNSEWILISTGDLSNGNNIDTGFYGNFAWYPMRVTGDGEKVKIEGIGDSARFAEIIRQNPYKH